MLALLASAVGLSKTEILSSVRGYAERYSLSEDNSNLERQFERDKEELRNIGILVETLEPLGEPGNNHTLRYRIPQEGYALPPQVRFSSTEVALLNLAALAWREGSLSTESRRAVTKLRSLGVQGDESFIGYAPRLRLREPTFEALNQAIEKNQVVRFDYLKAGESQAKEREVIPLALIHYDGRWHLASKELDSGAERTFLLRRIVSKVRPARVLIPESARGAEHFLNELEDLWAKNIAEVWVQEGSDAALRLAKRRGSVRSIPGVLQIHFADLAVLADELASFGPEVQVLSPQKLKEEVLTRLRQIMSDHG